MITLRDYQQEAVDEIRTALAKYMRVLFQLPTGGGKSACFAYMAFSSQKYNRKVLIMSDRSEILVQNGGTVERMGLSVQYVSPKYREIPTGNCVCSMSQTLKRRLDKEEWREWLKSIDFCIVDECHVCTHDFIYEYLSEKCFVLGVTATPARSGHQRQLGEIFRAMVTGISVKTLIEKGYLSPAKHFSVAAPKLDIPIDSATGDYNNKELAKCFESRTRYHGIVDEYLRIARGEKTICFCVSSKQCIDITKEFNERGVSAKYVLSGNFDDDEVYSGERNDVINDFKSGNFDVLVNVNCLTAGFDCPDVKCVILDFATVSIARYRQAVGRGSRIAPNKKDFIILDCGDNWRRLGFYDAETEWCLWHNTGSGGGLQVLKDCPTDKMDVNHKYGCGARVPTSCKVCPACGYKFHTEKDLFQLHLEEVSENEEDNLSSWAAKKKLEGWTLNRILVQCCLSNVGSEKKAFTEVYTTLYPDKSEQDANRYWYVFRKNVWDKIKKRNDNKKDNKQ